MGEKLKLKLTNYLLFNSIISGHERERLVYREKKEKGRFLTIHFNPLQTLSTDQKKTI